MFLLVIFACVRSPTQDGPDRMLEGLWGESWGDSRQRDGTYLDRYSIRHDGSWQITSSRSPEYRFEDTRFRRGTLSTIRYDGGQRDVDVIQYELHLETKNRLFGRGRTNRGDEIVVAWDRLLR